MTTVGVDRQTTDRQTDRQAEGGQTDRRTDRQRKEKKETIVSHITNSSVVLGRSSDLTDAFARTTRSHVGCLSKSPDTSVPGFTCVAPF